MTEITKSCDVHFDIKSKVIFRLSFFYEYYILVWSNPHLLHHDFSGFKSIILVLNFFKTFLTLVLKPTGPPKDLK
jgi:hypothetical protein